MYIRAFRPSQRPDRRRAGMVILSLLVLLSACTTAANQLPAQPVSPQPAAATARPSPAPALSAAASGATTATAEPERPANASPTPAPAPAPTSAALPAGPAASAGATSSPAAGAQVPIVASWDGVEQRLDQLVPGLLQQHNVPGLAVALVRDGQVVLARGYGLADRQSGAPMTEASVLQAASISKAVTAWGIMRLVEQGRLDLDAPVERYLTRWQLPRSRYDHAGVTLRRLLSHTAGLSLHGYPGLPPEQPLPTLEQSLSGGHAGAGDVRVVQEPGSAFKYSGGGYTLMQLIVEEVTDERFADYMRREVLAPLGMQHSSFEWTAELRRRTATGYDQTGQPLPNYLYAEQAPAGLYTTAADLARFVAAGLPGPDGEAAGRGVLRPETLALIYTPAPNTEQGYGMGYQTEVYGHGLVGHSGANRGWRCIFLAAPATGQGIVLLTNSDNGRHLYRQVLAELRGGAGH